MSSIYADIIIDISHEKLDRTFQYIVPESLLEKVSIGTQVQIPFGNANRNITGYVIGLGSKARYEVGKIKAIQDVVPMSVSAESRMISLAGWIRKTYGSTMIQALKTVMPVKQKLREKEERYLVLQLEEDAAREKLAYYQQKHQTARARLLEGLLEKPRITAQEAAKLFRTTAEVVKSMQEQGVLKVESERVYRGLIQDQEKESVEAAVLTPEQNQVLEAICQEWEQQNRPCLIQGVTGSGKTLVYMELMERILKEGRQAILLIPEIALTYQNVQRFFQRFGDVVTVLNSRMSQAERFDQMERARKGEVQIVIGPRSALFTPFPNLGLILIDEEHETSYKSEGTPRYHARETAIERARLEGAHVVLGSATPSMEASYACRRGRYALFLLQNRYQDAVLPQVYAVDMREELKSGNRSILSRPLAEAIQKRLERGEQSMLFLNRRGYAGFITCRSCGYVVKCPHCDVSLTMHSDGRLNCHYCGYQTEALTTCPSCGSPYIGGFRAGTQQIEQVVKKQFPEAQVLRMDLDTARGKTGSSDILQSFARREADILIGTQMIVKGHDFPYVTLMGVLAADLSLLASDYHAAERTYQLLVQAVGRAGRSSLAGEAVIQTYHPEHYSIQAAIRQDYDAFYEEEISYRMLLGYPPAVNLMAIHGACQSEEILASAMEYLKRYLLRVKKEFKTQVIGPAGESVSKINDLYRYVLYVRQGESEDLCVLREKLERYIEINKGFDPVYIQFDYN
ncbi:MAG: primosomal protein N' [Lachnospiraceae bacterium]|nr:primosomal protein N' [Lachnospiraceae bacterium]